MVKKNKRELMMITLQKATDFYLATLVTEGKSPRYIDWLKTRLKFFNQYMKETYCKDYKLQEITVEDGRDYLRSLMERNKCYQGHPMHTEENGKLKMQYIHGLGRAARRAIGDKVVAHEMVKKIRQQGFAAVLSRTRYSPLLRGRFGT